MKPGEVLFEEKDATGSVKLQTIAYDGPRGNRVRLTITEKGERDAGEEDLVLERDLLEGPGRLLGLALRKWVKRQKALRGDTPRGRRKIAAAAGAGEELARP